MKPARVLVVDDYSTNRLKMRMAVKRLGHEAEVAEDGASALEMLRAGDFDAVLLDILMPVMDGFDVLRVLKADEALRDIPVIVISSLDDETASVVKAIELGAEDFLPKDFDPILLEARLGASLEKKRFRDQEREYIARVARLTEAAEVLERGRFNPKMLQIDDIVERDDPLGRLAFVFKGMAEVIYERERRLQRHVRTLQGSLLVLAVGASWGIMPSLGRMAARFEANPLGLTVWVTFIAAVASLAIAVYRGGLPRPTWAMLRFYAVWAILAGIMQKVAVFWVTQHVPATTLSLIVTLEGFMVFAFAATIGLERASLRRLVGLAVGLVGVAIVMLRQDDIGIGGSPLWLVAALVVPLLFAVESLLLAARRPANVDIFAAVGVMMALSTAFLFPVAWWSGDLVALGPQFGPLEAIVLLMGIASTASIVLFTYLVATAGAVFASLSAYSMTVAGIVWGILLLSEEMTLFAWIALVLVLLGLYLVEPESAGEDVSFRVRRARARAVARAEDGSG